MSNRASTFVVLGFVLACCGGWSATVAAAKNDEAFQETVRAYSRESLPDATIVSRFTRLSEQGDPRPTLWLARLHWGGRCGLPKEPGIAYDLAEPVMGQVVKLAENGDHEAQFLVGSFHQEGLVLESDAAKAAAWYAKAIEGRQLTTYGNFAGLLAEGEGVAPDIGRARQLWREGAQQGSSFCREMLKEYAPPDSQSMARLRELRQSKLVAALGRRMDDAVRMLVEAGIITTPDVFIDFSSGRSSCLEFEDDGIILNAGLDGVVRCIDAYRGMTASDEARGGIPCGIAWSDGRESIQDKLGKPSWGGLLDSGVRQYGYPVGNLQFLLGVDVHREEVEFWRIRQMWQEDFPSEK